MLGVIINAHMNWLKKYYFQRITYDYQIYICLGKLGRLPCIFKYIYYIWNSNGVSRRRKKIVPPNRQLQTSTHNVYFVYKNWNICLLIFHTRLGLLVCTEISYIYGDQPKLIMDTLKQQINFVHFSKISTPIFAQAIRNRSFIRNHVWSACIHMSLVTRNDNEFLFLHGFLITIFASVILVT